MKKHDTEIFWSEEGTLLQAECWCGWITEWLDIGMLLHAVVKHEKNASASG